MARRPRKNKFRKKFTKLMQKKLVLLFVGIVLAFALLVGRITYINAFNGDKYLNRAGSATVSEVERFHLNEVIL